MVTLRPAYSLAALLRPMARYGSRPLRCPLLSKMASSSNIEGTRRPKNPPRLLAAVRGGKRDELIDLRGGRADAPAPPDEPAFTAPPIQQRSTEELVKLSQSAEN